MSEQNSAQKTIPNVGFSMGEGTYLSFYDKKTSTLRLEKVLDPYEMMRLCLKRNRKGIEMPNLSAEGISTFFG